MKIVIEITKEVNGKVYWEKQIFENQLFDGTSEEYLVFVTGKKCLDKINESINNPISINKIYDSRLG